MKKVYSKIRELAKPYYKKGRSMDLEHVEWMITEALTVCKKEGLDDSLLIPLVILHDVGYANIPKSNPFNLDVREVHMVEGAKITKKILEKLNYPQNKIKKIAYYVSVHDNWAFGDMEYKKDKVLGALKDLDFIWMVTSKGFLALMKILKKTPEKMIDYIQSRPKEENLVLTSKTTKKMFDKYLRNRKKEIFNNSQIET